MKNYVRHPLKIPKTYRRDTSQHSFSSSEKNPNLQARKSARSIVEQAGKIFMRQIIDDNKKFMKLK